MKEIESKDKKLVFMVELNFKQLVISFSCFILIISFFLPWTVSSPMEHKHCSGYDYSEGCVPTDYLFVAYSYLIWVLALSIASFHMSLIRKIPLRICTIICIGVSLFIMTHWASEIRSIPNSGLNFDYGFIAGIICGILAIVMSVFDSFLIQRKVSGSKKSAQC